MVLRGVFHVLFFLCSTYIVSPSGHNVLSLKFTCLKQPLLEGYWIIVQFIFYQFITIIIIKYIHIKATLYEFIISNYCISYILIYLII
jgi:hypothetical protein